MRHALLLMIIIAALSGCSAMYRGTVEVGKTIWGTSTRALENARSNAITKTYDKNYWELLRTSLDVAAKNKYEVYYKDEIKGVIVLMGIKGSVNTTEVGLFFTELNDNQTRLEISSLSSNAKRIVAKHLLHGLDVAFGLAPPDPEPAPAEPAPKTK